jgi:type VI secretion system secreted protein VgrG
MSVTQENRQIAIATSLGPDVLLFKKMLGTEELGRLFEYKVELLSSKVDIVFDDIVGQNVTIRLEMPLETRYFNGFVSRFSQMDGEGEFAKYQAILVPWLWFLSQTSDCRIFQEKTVPDILAEVFKAHGFEEYELRLTGTYRTWEYCVQYRETDLDFVSRLMEQEGIYYFFVHENGKHTLILADSPSAHEPCPGGYEEITYRPPEENSSEESETIHYWSMHKKFLTTDYAHDDFDFKNPKSELLSKSQIPREHGGAGFERYDYHGEYVTAGEGEEYAKVRIEEVQVQHEVFQGKAGARGIVLGHKFNLKEFYREDQNQEYMVTGIQHAITSDDYGSTRVRAEKGDKVEKEKLYTCMSGFNHQESWLQKQELVDYYQAKSVASSIFSQLGYTDYSLRQGTNENFSLFV